MRVAEALRNHIGTRTSTEYFGITPDIISVPKTLGGGLPLSAVITTNEIEDDIHQRGSIIYKPRI